MEHRVSACTLDDPKVKAVLDRLHREGKGDKLRYGLKLLPYLAQKLLLRKPSFTDQYRRLADLGISVSAEQGMFAYLVARSIGARRIVEFGTSFGVSTIYLASAVRDNGGGIVIGSEFIESKAERARANILEAGLSDSVEIRVGDAMETLADPGGEIDLLLIDGSKELYLPILKMLDPTAAAGRRGPGRQRALSVHQEDPCGIRGLHAGRPPRVCLRYGSLPRRVRVFGQGLICPLEGERISTPEGVKEQAMTNPWLTIPAEDYEAHMASPEVGQLQVLNQLFKMVLEEHRPESLAVLGCSTGNGFEHIDPQHDPAGGRNRHQSVLPGRRQDEIPGLTPHARASGGGFHIGDLRHSSGVAGLRRVGIRIRGCRRSCPEHQQEPHTRRGSGRRIAASEPDFHSGDEDPVQEPRSPCPHHEPRIPGRVLPGLFRERPAGSQTDASPLEQGKELCVGFYEKDRAR